MQRDLEAMLTRARAARERADAATSGPWEVHYESNVRTAVKQSGVFDWICHMQVSNQPNFRNDSAFIAASRQDVPALAADVEALVERVRRYEMFAEHNAAYAELRNDPEAWAAELAERAAWDVTLMDGLDDAAPQPAASPATTDAKEGTT